MLWPIKIDASATDSSVRLVDTLILDSTSLPVPPARAPSNVASTIDQKTLLQETIDSNALFLAATLISDMECFGITRINKTFIGRVKLWDAAPGLYQQVLDQISQQLSCILTNDWNFGSVIFDTALPGNDNADPSKKSVNHTTTHSNELIHIKLRLRENNIYIVDDFFLDPKLPSSNPFIIASTLAHDLRLRPDMVNSIAITILEQMHGLQIEDTVQGLPKVMLPTPAVPSSQGNIALQPQLLDVTPGMTAAWAIRNKDEMVARDHVVEHYRIHK